MIQVRKFEESEQLLKCQLEEVSDQNEEMEFRILELEECTEKVKLYIIIKMNVKLYKYSKIVQKT